MDNSQVAVHAVAGLLRGRLGVATVRTAVVETAHLLVEFHCLHPGVDIVVEEPTDDRGVIEVVRNGRCDIGVIHSSERPTDIEGVRAAMQQIVAIFPETLAPRSKTVTLAHLAEVPLIAPLPGSSARLLHDARFRRLAKRPNIVAECSDHSVLIEMVRGGIGAALVSDSRVATVGTHQLAARGIRPDMNAELTAIRRSASSPAAESFCAMLESARSGRGGSSER